MELSLNLICTPLDGPVRIWSPGSTVTPVPRGNARPPRLATTSPTDISTLPAGSASAWVHQRPHVSAAAVRKTDLQTMSMIT